MDVTADAVFFAAYNEGNLRMGLQAHNTIDNVAAGFFQLGRHVNVVFFIKAGLHFHENRDLLAVFRSLGQSGNNQGLTAYTV